jgi:hypothetical protein
MPGLRSKIFSITSTQKKLLTVVIFLAISLISFINDGFTKGRVLCPILAITGHQCPGCGSIRSIAAFSQGDLWASFTYNPITFAFIALLLTSIFLPGSYVRLNNYVVKTLNLHNRVILTLTIVALFVGSWIITLIRW